MGNGSEGKLRKINLIWMIGIVLVLALPFVFSITGIPRQEVWGYSATTVSNWVSNQNVYLIVAPNCTSINDVYNLSNFTTMTGASFTAGQIFNITQQHTDTPVATCTRTGDNCVFPVGYLMNCTKTYYLSCNGDGGNIKQDETSVSFPAVGINVNLTGSGYGDSGSWTAQNTQARCITSFWGQEISLEPPADSTPPTINISINNTNPLRNDIINVTARVTDATAIASCFLQNNVTNLLSSTKTLSGVTDQCSFAFRLPYTLTTYNLTLNVSDSLGNAGQNSTSIAVNPPSYTCPVGNATGWSWTPITISSMIKNGSAYDWKWRTYAI